MSNRIEESLNNSCQPPCPQSWGKKEIGGHPRPPGRRYPAPLNQGFLKSFLLVLLIILPLAITSCDVTTKDQGDSAPNNGVELVEDVWGIISDEYVDRKSLTVETQAEGAIRGLIESLNDPYTTYLNPRQYALSRSQLEGEFGGIGATLNMEDDRLIIVAPLPGSPAQQAGVSPGDRILEIDGVSPAGLALDEAILKIRGKKGTKVKLLLLHTGSETPVEVEITRDNIILPSVEWKMLPGNIAHVQVITFSDRTDAEIISAIKEAAPQGATGIVLDLRNNLGGIVDTAVSAVSQFVEDGIVVYSINNKGEREDWRVRRDGPVLAIPLAVLVNDHSASASEIVAGALQDYGRGPIIGVKTFGKGSMNRVHALSNGGALYLTFARWYTPKGRLIEKDGITPDIIVEMSPEATPGGPDPQLDRAVQYLQESG